MLLNLFFFPLSLSLSFSSSPVVIKFKDKPRLCRVVQSQPTVKHSYTIETIGLPILALSWSTQLGLFAVVSGETFIVLSVENPPFSN